MANFEEDQATIGRRSDAKRAGGNPWKGERAVVAAVRKAHPHNLTE
jgi:hypothetical protein